MKKNILTSIGSLLKNKAVLAVSGSMLLVSCHAHMGAYGDSGGVYYDPETDTLPEGVIVEGNRNQVGEYYNYNENTSLENSKINQYNKNNKYENWSQYGSDWGNYAGSETNYYTDYWGSYGWLNPYWGSGFGIGFSWGWGSKFNWGYNPYWFGYNPYWGYGSIFGGYYPYYYGYSPFYYGYSPYYYNYSPYYGNYYNGHSNTSVRGYNSYLNNGSPFIGNPYRTANNQNSGFRNGLTNSSIRPARSNSTRGFDGNSVPRSQNQTAVNPRPGSVRPNVDPYQSRPRTSPRFETSPRNESSPRYESMPRNNGGFRNDTGGFRGNSGGFNSGSSGGGFRGGSSGGVRSGGFR